MGIGTQVYMPSRNHEHEHRVTTSHFSTMATLLNCSSYVLVTGYTGFLGKVVVEELCRQQINGLLPYHKILVLIRPNKGLTAKERFGRTTNAICFSKLPVDWTSLVEVLEADLALPYLGLDSLTYENLCASTTHIIHCAASIDFKLPLAEATRANVNTSMNMLRFAQECSQLRQMVDVSTAYVSSPHNGTVQEALAPLPENMSAEYLYKMILSGDIDEAQLLRISGHPNTYTITKCLAEHFLHEKRGTTPLTIVRPSIISASLSYPFPGYIDSYAAMGGMVALYGSGFLHVLEGRPDAVFDVVPVDVVAQHIIDASRLSDVDAKSTDSFKIFHSVAGLHDSCSLKDLKTLAEQYFRTRPGLMRPYWAYTGPRDAKSYCFRLVTQTIPLSVFRGLVKITGNKKLSRQLDIIKRGIEKIDESITFFAEHTFDFATDRRISEGYSSTAYVQLLMEGVHRHLIRRELYVDLPKV
jgi:fatty acyl-CoA reductase